MKQHLEIRAFKAAVLRDGATRLGPASAPTLRKVLIAKAEEAGTRRIKFTISTSAVDLDNDTVNQDGWDLSVYRTNPLCLWMHDNMQLPVGKCVSIGLEAGKLKAVTEFVPASVPIAGPMAEAVYQMCRGGFLSATSVGFMPLAYDIAADRTGDSDWLPAVNFTSQRLLEFSIVTVPANSEALIDPAERDGAASPPAHLQAHATRTAAQRALDTVFEKHRRLARILGTDNMAKSAASPPARKTPGAPISIPEAMARGWTNSEILAGMASGSVKTFPNRGIAMREAPGHYSEMLRRGFLP